MKTKSNRLSSTTSPHLKYLILLTVLSISSACHEVPQGTEILWDTWGVPHIYAKDSADLLCAYGWAQMHNHGDLILRLYGQARGRAAEYWGESYLEDDRLLRLMGVPQRSQSWYEAQSPEFRTYLDAFIAGMNAYAERHRDKIDDEVEVVLPIRATDVLSHTQRTIHLTFVGWVLPSMAKKWQGTASNAWAIAPSRSANGNAMLLANPHLPWSDRFTWIEAQLTAPGINAYGATLVGTPMLGIAFNDYLGWSHTVNTFDGLDVYELTLTDGGYRWDGGSLAFETEQQIIKVKLEDGTLREEKLVMKQSVHGPVLAEKNGKAIAVRMTGLDQPHMFEQYWDMVRATNLKEFEQALERLQIPTFNVIYADRDGHILYFFGGRTPKRPFGDWSDWQGTIPGDSSATLWTETHTYRDLPRVVDPESGWVQNANDPPWTSTFPMALNPDDFPAYLSPDGMAFRPQRSVRMLDADKQVTFAELIHYKHSTRMELADRILDDLLPATQQYGAPLAKKAAEVLQNWDRRADADSRGAVLFTAWAREVGFGVFATPWSKEQPRITPDGLKDPKAAASALQRAAQRVRDKYGALNVPWGEVYKLRYAGKDLPANGGPGKYGIFRVLNFASEEDGRFRAVGGDSYVALVEFSKPVKAKTLLSYGNATQPNSPHRGDQLQLFARKELRPVWRTREEIEVHLEKREALYPDTQAVLTK